MRQGRTVQKRRKEAGIALLIAIFILLLIGVVAIALVVSSGTESALAGNYRSSSSAYYAALAGVEEVRARLRPNDPNSFSKLNPGTFLPVPGTPLAPCSPVYVLNPAQGEVVTPWDSSNPYYDQQFGQEFGAACGTNVPPSPSPSTTSVWRTPGNPLNGLPFPPPSYKWVRISAITEQSQGLDVSPYDGIDAKLISYDNVQQQLNDQGTGAQVLEITALAALPNNTQRLVQYLVASQPMNLSFPAALILDGTTPQFGASPAAGFYVKGIDQGSAGTCNPGPATHTAFGYTDTSYTAANFEQPGSAQGIPAGLKGNYTNGVAPNPDVAAVTLSPNLATVGELNNLVQMIEQNADVVVNGNGTQTNSGGPLPSAMSATNPMTIVINGDFTFNGWRNTGYGLLLVTGNLTYDPDASWDGIILVIGKGSMSSQQGSFANTSIQGAVLIANTVGLPASSPPASSNFNFFSTPASLQNGIYYSSCWIQKSLPSSGYRILSFHEVSQ